MRYVHQCGGEPKAGQFTNFGNIADRRRSAAPGQVTTHKVMHGSDKIQWIALTRLVDFIGWMQKLAQILGQHNNCAAALTATTDFRNELYQ